MIELRDGFDAYAEDFAWCENVIKRNSKSFYQAFSLLPHQKRSGVYALYAFCRQADDSVDRDVSWRKLENLQTSLVHFFAGSVPDVPLWRALAVVFERFDMERQPFFDMLEGQRRDLSFRQPKTLSELEDYGYFVAGSVGLMLLPLLHARTEVDAGVRESAVALGVAMQLTNILRDVGEDWGNGRIYLPQSVLDDVRYSQQDLAAHEANEAFIRAWETVAQRSEELYRPMERDVFELDEDSRRATLSSLFLYRGILNQVRADGYACLERRSRVSRVEAGRLMAKAEMLLHAGASAESAPGSGACRQADVAVGAASSFPRRGTGTPEKPPCRVAMGGR